MNDGSRIDRSKVSRRAALGIAASGAGLALVPTISIAASTSPGQRSESRSVSTPDRAVANTQYGRVRGSVRGGVFTFKGIPYGADTAGENRWLPPKPPQPWTDIRSSLTYGPVCPHPPRRDWGKDETQYVYFDDFTVYASYGHSWRAGTANTPLESTDPRITALAVVPPEESDNFEVGLKSQLFDRKLTFNITAFYQKFDGYIFGGANFSYIDTVPDPTKPEVATSGFGTLFGAKANVEGVDIDISYQPTDQFYVSGSVNYAKGRIDDTLPCNDSNFDGVPDNGETQLEDLQSRGLVFASCKYDDPLIRRPDWGATLQAEQTFAVRNDVDMYIRALSTYTPTNETASVEFSADSYVLLNLYVGARINHDDASTWDVGLYVNNVTDDNTEITRGGSIRTPNDTVTVDALGGQGSIRDYLGLAADTGYHTTSVLPRREYGVTARYSFATAK